MTAFQQVRCLLRRGAAQKKAFRTPSLNVLLLVVTFFLLSPWGAKRALSAAKDDAAKPSKVRRRGGVRSSSPGESQRRGSRTRLLPSSSSSDEDGSSSSDSEGSFGEEAVDDDSSGSGGGGVEAQRHPASELTTGGAAAPPALPTKKTVWLVVSPFAKGGPKMTPVKHGSSVIVHVVSCGALSKDGLTSQCVAFAFKQYAALKESPDVDVRVVLNVKTKALPKIGRQLRRIHAFPLPLLFFDGCQMRSVKDKWSHRCLGGIHALYDPGLNDSAYWKSRYNGILVKTEKGGQHLVCFTNTWFEVPDGVRLFHEGKEVKPEWREKYVYMKVTNMEVRKGKAPELPKPQQGWTRRKAHVLPQTENAVAASVITLTSQSGVGVEIRCHDEVVHYNLSYGKLDLSVNYIDLLSPFRPTRDIVRANTYIIYLSKSLNPFRGKVRKALTEKHGVEDKPKSIYRIHCYLTGSLSSAIRCAYHVKRGLNCETADIFVISPNSTLIGNFMDGMADVGKQYTDCMKFLIYKDEFDPLSPGYRNSKTLEKQKPPTNPSVYFSQYRQNAAFWRQGELRCYTEFIVRFHTAHYKLEVSHGIDLPEKAMVVDIKWDFEKVFVPLLTRPRDPSDKPSKPWRKKKEFVLFSQPVVVETFVLRRIGEAPEEGDSEVKIFCGGERIEIKVSNDGSIKWKPIPVTFRVNHTDLVKDKDMGELRRKKLLGCDNPMCVDETSEESGAALPGAEAPQTQGSASLPQTSAGGEAPQTQDSAPPLQTSTDSEAPEKDTATPSSEASTSAQPPKAGSTPPLSPTSASADAPEEPTEVRTTTL